MTPKEAILRINEIEGFVFDEKLHESLMCGVEALKKQIPKKPILKHNIGRMHINKGNKPHEWRTLESYDWHCPVCDRFVGEQVRHPRVYFLYNQMKKDYCEKCGQAILWEEVNE